MANWPPGSPKIIHGEGIAGVWRQSIDAGAFARLQRAHETIQWSFRLYKGQAGHWIEVPLVESGHLAAALKRALISAFYFVLSAFAWRWLVRDVQGSRFRVQGSRFRVHHKHPEYNSPLPPPSGWSGGTLVPPWAYPGTIDPLPDLLFDQARLFKSVSSGFSVAQPYLGLDVGCWMFSFPRSPFAIRSWPSVSATARMYLNYRHLRRVH
jgi:hypothetical protein